MSKIQDSETTHSNTCAPKAKKPRTSKQDMQAQAELAIELLNNGKTNLEIMQELQISKVRLKEIMADGYDAKQIKRPPATYYTVKAGSNYFAEIMRHLKLQKNDLIKLEITEAGAIILSALTSTKRETETYE